MRGNSETLVKKFAKAAEEAGHKVEVVNLRDKTIKFCIGCLVCQKTKHCVIADDANVIAQKMLIAEVIAFVKRVCFYGMSGQMKTMLDRSNPLYPSDYAFRDIYLLASAAEEGECAIDGTIKGIQGLIALKNQD
jgi:multimeric flavodoxin WrbA